MKSRIWQQHKEAKDIRNWVRDVVGDAKLASKFAGAKTKRDAIKVLEKKAGKTKESVQVAVEKEASALEIETAIEGAVIPDKNISSFDEKERKLEEEEKLLDMEEDHMNKKRIELANKRYILLKEKGELEKQKFDEMLKKDHIEEHVEPEHGGMPELELTEEYTKEKIQSLIEETRRSIEQGNLEAAKKLVNELKTGLDFAQISTDDSKKLGYDVLELEADLKLATLV